MSLLGVCSNPRSFTKQPRGVVSGVCARNPSTKQVPSSSLIETDALGSSFEIEATLRFSTLNLSVSPTAVLTSLTRSSEPLVYIVIDLLKAAACRATWRAKGALERPPMARTPTESAPFSS